MLPAGGASQSHPLMVNTLRIHSELDPGSRAGLELAGFFHLETNVNANAARPV